VEQNHRDFRPKVENVEPAKPQKHLAQHAFDVSDFPIVESFPEAHEHKQVEHGVLEVMDDFYWIVGL